MKKFRTTSKISLLKQKCRPIKNMHGLPCPYSAHPVHFSVVLGQLMHCCKCIWHNLIHTDQPLQLAVSTSEDIKEAKKHHSISLLGSFPSFQYQMIAWKKQNHWLWSYLFMHCDNSNLFPCSINIFLYGKMYYFSFLPIVRHTFKCLFVSA